MPDCIYYYITLACNLRCAPCYMGGQLKANQHASLDLIRINLEIQSSQGAREVVFLGGEPTLHPDYPQILAAARQAGFDRIVVDSNGTARDPLQSIDGFIGPITIRFSFDGPEAIHNTLRGEGTFQRTLAVLRQAVHANRSVEATITLHALNIDRIAEMVSFFSHEGINELNFHFISWMGNARQAPHLGLTPAIILKAQDALEIQRRAALIPMRYPRLLVPETEWKMEISNGLACRFSGAPRLIFPDGKWLHCPLEIGAGIETRVKQGGALEFDGCPLAWRLIPGGVPSGYRMTCISWKPARMDSA